MGEGREDRILLEDCRENMEEKRGLGVKEGRDDRLRGLREEGREEIAEKRGRREADKRGQRSVDSRGRGQRRNRREVFWGRGQRREGGYKVAHILEESAKRKGRKRGVSGRDGRDERTDN